jgi:hypothetical protein
MRLLIWFIRVFAPISHGKPNYHRREKEILILKKNSRRKQPMSYRTLLALLITVCSGLCCKSQIDKSYCVPNGYELSTGFGAIYDLNFNRVRLVDSTDRRNVIANYWIYDEKGRVIIDSLKALDSHSRFAPYTTVHYLYVKDSVIGITRDTLTVYVNDSTMAPDTSGYRIYIRLNSNGLPVYSYNPTNRKLFASYNADGTLAGIDQECESDKIVPFIDNISYLNGDITSYRDVEHNPYKVSCSYYDKDADPVFGPQKPFALNINPMFGTLIDVQAFSKHLLKSVTMYFSGSTKTRSYTYKFDKNGKPIEMIRLCDDPISGKDSSLFTFKYSCD